MQRGEKDLRNMISESHIRMLARMLQAMFDWISKLVITLHVVTAARALSPKLHISYLDLCCLDTRTLPLSSLGITLCI